MRGLAVVVALALGPVAQAQEPPPIQDNSFLIEEAYNQEHRVVQHISAFYRSRDAWWYTFTQEWPAGGQRSQLSYTVPLLDGGVGDVALNYRLQLVGPAGSVALSPRVSLVLPTGDETQGRGSGAVGVQVNLPLSARLARRLVTHWNAGATWTGGAQSSTAYAAGASAIWEIRSTFNALVEIAWSRADGVDDLLINPGIRWAHNIGGLQVVPGIGVPLALGPTRRPAALFLYLSLEHPF